MQDLQAVDMEVAVVTLLVDTALTLEVDTAQDLEEDTAPGLEAITMGDMGNK